MASKTVIRPNTCCTLGKLSLGEFSPRKGKILAARADKAGENNKAIDPICCNSCIVLPMFFRLVLANSLFSLRDINLTLRLLPPRRHVVWRDSVGVEIDFPKVLRRISYCISHQKWGVAWLAFGVSGFICESLTSMAECADSTPTKSI